MLDLQVNQQPGSISTNFQEIETALKEHLENYKGITVTADSIKESKKDLTELRKLRESIEDARKNVKKQWMQPYTEFEVKCKELVGLVDKPIDEINAQLQLFEEDRKREKLEHVKEVYADNIGSLEEFLPFDSVFDPKWLNVSCKDQDIIFSLQERTLRVKTDIQAIKALNSEIYDSLIETYISNGNDLASAIQRNNQYMEDKAKVAEQIREEVKEEVKAELPVQEPKEETKPKAEAMGTLNDMVNLCKTVHIVISAEDLQAAKNALDFSEIKYQIIEN